MNLEQSVFMWDKTIFFYFSNFQFLINRVAWVFPDFQYVWLAEETKKNLPKELDFKKEGEHCERAAKMFSHFDFLKVVFIVLEMKILILLIIFLLLGFIRMISLRFN